MNSVVEIVGFAAESYGLHKVTKSIDRVNMSEILAYAVSSASASIMYPNPKDLPFFYKGLDTSMKNLGRESYISSLSFILIILYDLLADSKLSKHEIISHLIRNITAIPVNMALLAGSDSIKKGNESN